MKMKIKIAAVISILIYILLLLFLDKNPILVGYLCAIDFAISFILFVFIFKDPPPKSNS